MVVECVGGVVCVHLCGGASSPLSLTVAVLDSEEHLLKRVALLPISSFSAQMLRCLSQAIACLTINNRTPQTMHIILDGARGTVEGDGDQPWGGHARVPAGQRSRGVRAHQEPGEAAGQGWV